MTLTDPAGRDEPAAAHGPERPAATGLGWLSHASPRQITMLMVSLIVVGSVAAGAAATLKPTIGVGLAVVFGFALLVMRRLEIGGLLLVALVPVLSGIRRGFPVPSLKLTEILTVGVATMVFVTLRQVHARPWGRIEWSLLVFVLLYFGMGFLDARQLGVHLTSSNYGSLLGPLQFFLLFRAIRLVLTTRKMQERALRVLLYSSLPVAALGMMQQVKVPGIRSFLANITASATLLDATSSGYSSFARATGPFPHWTPYAGYLTVIIVVMVAMLLEPGIDLFSRRRLALMLLFDAIGLLLSAELSAIIGLLIAMFLLAWWSNRLTTMLKALGVAALVFSFTAGPLLVARLEQEYTKTAGTKKGLLPQTIEYRWQIWTTQYFPAIGQRPLEGYGVTLPPIIVWQDTESQYVTLLMAGGAPLVFAYIVMMGSLGSAGAALSRDPEDALRRVTGRSTMGMVIILVPMSIVFPYFQDSGLPQPLWVLAAIMMSTVPGRLPGAGLAALPRRLRTLGRSGTRWRRERLVPLGRPVSISELGAAPLEAPVLESQVSGMSPGPSAAKQNP